MTFSPSSELRIETTMALMGGIMQGVALDGARAPGRGERVTDAQRTAERYRDECFAMAGRLIELDAQTYPDHNGLRVRATATLMAGAVAGQIGGGVQVSEALVQAGRQRERMLSTAQRVIEQQLGLDATPTTNPGERNDPARRSLGLGDWRKQQAERAEPAPTKLNLSLD